MLFYVFIFFIFFIYLCVYIYTDIQPGTRKPGVPPHGGNTPWGCTPIWRYTHNIGGMPPLWVVHIIIGGITPRMRLYPQAVYTYIIIYVASQQPATRKPGVPTLSLYMFVYVCICLYMFVYICVYFYI